MYIIVYIYVLSAYIAHYDSNVNVYNTYRYNILFDAECAQKRCWWWNRRVEGSSAFIRTFFLAPGPNICLAPNVRRRRRRRRCRWLRHSSVPRRLYYYILEAAPLRERIFMYKNAKIGSTSLYALFPRWRPPRDRYANLGLRPDGYNNNIVIRKARPETITRNINIITFVRLVRQYKRYTHIVIT